MCREDPSLTNVTVRRLWLAAYARRAREAAGLDQESAARLLLGPNDRNSTKKVDTSRISKVENGRLGLRPDTVRLLFTAYGVTDQEEIEWLIALARSRDAKGRWKGHRASVPLAQRVYYDLEEEALALDGHFTEVIPGLFQTQAYMRAQIENLPRALLGVSNPHEDSDAFLRRRADEIVATRTGRQRSVLDCARQVDLHFVLSESCLRRIVGGNAVMAEAMAHLVALSHRPNIRIQILPFDAPGSALVFTKLRIRPLRTKDDPLDVVYLAETLHQADYDDDPGHVLDYDNMHGHLASGALSRDESRRMILRYAGTYS